MSNTNLPDETPNVVVQNPAVRRVANAVIGVTGLVLGSVIVADLASPAFDLSVYTDPISAVYLYLASGFGLGVTLPNVPRR
jgi:hypothetical protein